MKVTESGWYRTRDGRLAEVVVSDFKHGRPVIGYIIGEGFYLQWALTGDCDAVIDHADDLVEYLGKERPKQKKTVKMAPALFYFDGIYGVSTHLYKSEQQAKSQLSIFVRWLIDTHAVEVEVEE
jgi:hypothetical protein